MKKTIAMILSVIMIAGTSVPAVAADGNRIGQAIAYERIDESTVESRKTAILAARAAIIYSESWVADGVYGEILDRNGNVKEVLPQFSEIFPEDWDIPVERNSYSVLISSYHEYDIYPFFEDSIWLSSPTNQNTPPFCSFATTVFAGTRNEIVVETVYASGIYKNPSETAYYNLGYSNVTTGASLGYKVDLANGDTFTINPPKNITIGVRASSNNYTGDWSMRVDGKRVFTGQSA